MSESASPQPPIIDAPQALLDWLGKLDSVRATFTDQPLLIVLSVLLIALLVIEVSYLLQVWRDWQHRRRVQGAQEIVILSPAEVDPHGVNLWWDQVASLLRRGRWRRLLYGPDYLTYELRWTEQELSIVIWVPATVPVKPVAAAVRAAWPGATATVRPAEPPLAVITGQDPSVGQQRASGSPGAGTTTQRKAYRGPSEKSGNDGRPSSSNDVDGGWPSRLLVRAFDGALGGPAAARSPRGASNPSHEAAQEVDEAGPEVVPPIDSGDTDMTPEGFEIYAAGRQVQAKLPGWYTFRDRSDHGVDPMRAVLEQGSGLGSGRSACVQVLVRPPSPRGRYRARAGAAGLKTGQVSRHGGFTTGVPRALAVGTGALAGKVLLAALDIALEILGSILSAFSGGSSHGRTRTGPRQGTSTSTAARRSWTSPLQDQDARRGLEKVRTGQLWEVSVRMAVIRTVHERSDAKRRSAAARKQHADAIKGELQQQVHALAAALGVHDDRNGLLALPLRDSRHCLSDRRMGRAFVMGTPELASLAALPTDVAVPGLDRAQARSRPAPVGLASGGRGVKVLGRSAGTGRPVGITARDARQHVHVLGSTGVGKSTLMCRMILADINAGRGVVIIDPKGDLALDVVARLPKQALPRLVLIDPDQPTGSAAFNPLEVRPGMDPALQVDNLTAIFRNTFSPYWGPRVDDVLRVVCLTLMRRPGARMTLIPAMLNNKKVRAPFTADLNDSAGLGGFWKWYDEQTEGLRAQVIGPVLARLRSFLLRDFVKFTIGRETSTFDIGEVLDGGILIVRIPKGQMGEDASKLLGSMMLASVWQAATARASMPEHERKDAAVYIDEAHNVLNLDTSVSDMLPESRAYGVSFVLAHQHLGQLDKDKVQPAVSANARNKVFFTCSPEDARILARHTEPDLDEYDLSHLGPFTAAARLMSGNREMRSFTLNTLPLPTPDPTALQHVRDYVGRTGPRAAPEDLPDESDPSS